MEKLNIQLSINEANTILRALGNMPYLQVAGLIQTIQNQANGQLKPIEAAAENAAATEEAEKEMALA